MDNSITKVPVKKGIQVSNRYSTILAAELNCLSSVRKKLVECDVVQTGIARKIKSNYQNNHR